MGIIIETIFDITLEKIKEIYGEDVCFNCKNDYKVKKTKSNILVEKFNRRYGK